MALHRTIGLMVAVLACLVGPSVGAQDVRTELEFASGLSELGYFDLAAEKFQQMNWREMDRGDLQVQVAVGAIENYLDAAQVTREPEQAVDYLLAASREAADLAEQGVATRYHGQLQMYRGDIQLELGRARTRQYRIAEQDARPPIAEQASQAFGGAVEVFQQAADHYREIIEAIEAKASVSDQDRRVRNESITQEVAARTQVAWAYYRRAEFHDLAGNEDAYEADLEQAREIFGELSDVHSDILAGVSATLGRGMALARLGRHEEAVEAFDKVLQVRTDRAVAIFRFQAAYEKAGSLRELERFDEAVDTLREISGEFGALPPMLEVSLRMRYARILGAAGESSLEQAEKMEKEAADLQKKGRRAVAGQMREDAQGLRRDARNFYAGAIRQARTVASTGMPEAREAQVLLGRWLELPGLEGLESPTDLFARGEAALEEDRAEEAAKFYNDAIVAAKASEDGAPRIVHNAWIQLGKAHMKQGDKAAAGHAFMQVAQNFPDSPFAEKTAVYATVLLGQVYKENTTEETAEAYVAAQELLVDNFPHNETARKAAFRLGEIARDRGEYRKAAEYYLKVGTASEFYEKAQYLAGLSFYRASGAARAEGEERAAERLFQRADVRLSEFVEWTREETSGSAEVRAERNRWAANALLLNAQMYDDTNQPRELLKLLDERAEETFQRVEEGEELVSRARLLRLAAHAGIGGEHNDMAQEELRSILDDPQIDADLKAEAARVVGQNYVRQARRLERQAEGDPAITQADVREAFGKAKESLQMSLTLNPEQTAAQYVEVARTLYQAGAYQEAARTFRELVEKFEDDEDSADAVRDAQRWIGRCHVQAEAWDEAVAQYEGLLEDNPRWTNLRAELARLYGREEVARYSDASRHWRRVERTRRAGTADWFEARYERIRTRALAGGEEMAYQLMATTAVSYPKLGGGEQQRQYLEFAREHFTDEQIERIENLTEKDR